MKKIVTFVLAACAMLTALHAGTAEKSFYFIKVKSGNVDVVRKVYLDSNKECQDGKDPKDGKVVFSWEDTQENVTVFLGKLSKIGYIEKTSNSSSFTIIVLEGEDVMLFSVDSSNFKNLPNELLKLQAVFGKNVNGGEKDQIQSTKRALLISRTKLEEAGFDCIIDQSHIVIQERRYTHTFSFPPALKDLVKAELEVHTKDIKAVGNNAFEVQLTHSQLAAMQKHLLSTGGVSKISKNANGITTIEAIPLKKYKVKIMLNNQFEYDKIVPEISKLKFKVTDKELRESGFGVCIAIFEVTAKKASASDIKAGVWRAVRSVAPGIKNRSITVQAVENNN